MQITQAQVGNVLYPLVEGQPLSVVTGDVLKIFFGFRYKIDETSDVAIWASLYKKYTARIDRADDAQTKTVITLEKTFEWKEVSGEIDILIPKVSGALGGLITGGIDEGLWGLIVELPDYNVDGRIENCIEAIAPPGLFDTIGQLIPMLILVMIMGMIMPLMEEGMGPAPGKAPEAGGT